MPKEGLNTILSTRDYRQDAACLVAVQTKTNPLFSLDDSAKAIRQPKFVLYLGRKTCPPSLPLWPQVIAAENVFLAMETYRAKLSEQTGYSVAALERIVWGVGIEPGVLPCFSVQMGERCMCARRPVQSGSTWRCVRL